MSAQFYSAWRILEHSTFRPFPCSGRRLISSRHNSFSFSSRQPLNSYSTFAKYELSSSPFHAQDRGLGLDVWNSLVLHPLLVDAISNLYTRHCDLLPDRHCIGCHCQWMYFCTVLPRLRLFLASETIASPCTFRSPWTACPDSDRRIQLGAPPAKEGAVALKWEALSKFVLLGVQEHSLSR